MAIISNYKRMNGDGELEQHFLTTTGKAVGLHGYAVPEIVTPVTSSDNTTIAIGKIDKKTQSLEEQKANMSTVSTHTLQSANWVNGVYTLTVAGMTAERYGEVNPADNATDEQILAMQGANAIIRSGAGKLTFTALGKVPTINVPVTVIVRGDVQ